MQVEVAHTLAALLTLRPAFGRRAPLPLRKLLPEPLRSLEEWERFVHADIAGMQPAIRSAEAFRLRIAIAQTDEECVPLWPLERVARLEAGA